MEDRGLETRTFCQQDRRAPSRANPPGTGSGDGNCTRIMSPARCVNFN